jgi:excisionase family DNA binding protein
MTATFLQSEIAGAGNWYWRKAGGRPEKLAVGCHQYARNGAFFQGRAIHTRRDPEPAMPEPTADRQLDLLTIAEAAELLRAPVATLRYWRHLGTGPTSFRLGRRVLYRREDLHAWITSEAGWSSGR